MTSEWDKVLQYLFQLESLWFLRFSYRHLLKERPDYKRKYITTVVNVAYGRITLSQTALIELKPCQGLSHCKDIQVEVPSIDN